MFEFGEDLFDWIEIGRIWRQEEQSCADFANSLTDGLAFVTAKIVHNNHISGLQRRHQDLLDIGQEPLTVDRPVEDARRLEPITAQSCQKGLRSPPAMGCFADQTLAARCPTA